MHYRKGKQRESSVRKGARLINDQIEQKRLQLLGIEPETGVYHLQIRSMYGKIWSIYVGQKLHMVTGTDTDTVGNFQIRYWFRRTGY
jgi:hypothetical protein